MAKVEYSKCDRCGSPNANHRFEEGHHDKYDGNRRKSWHRQDYYVTRRQWIDFDLCDMCLQDLSNFMQDHKHDPVAPEVNPIGAAVAQTTQANRGGIIGALARKL